MSAGEAFYGDPLGPAPACAACDDEGVVTERRPGWRGDDGTYHEPTVTVMPCPACCRSQRIAMTTMLAASRVARRTFLPGVTR